MADGAPETNTDDAARAAQNARHETIGRLVLVALLGGAGWWFFGRPQMDRSEKLDAALAMLDEERAKDRRMDRWAEQLNSEPPSCANPHMRLGAMKLLRDQLGHHYKLNDIVEESRSRTSARCAATLHGVNVPGWTGDHRVIYYLRRTPDGVAYVEFDSANEY